MIISFLTLKKISPLSNRISKNSDSNLIQKARKNTASVQSSRVLLFLQYYQSWPNYLEIVVMRVIYSYWWMISIYKIPRSGSCIQCNNFVFSMITSYVGLWNILSFDSHKNDAVSIRNNLSRFLYKV